MSIKEYLSFTKRERYGIVALLIIMALVAFLPQLVPKPKPVPLPATAIQQLTDRRSADSIQSGYRRRTEYNGFERGSRYGPGDDDLSLDSAYRAVYHASRYHYSDRDSWQRAASSRKYYGRNDYYGVNDDRSADRFRERRFQQRDRYPNNRYFDRRLYVNGNGTGRFYEAGRTGAGRKDLRSDQDSTHREYGARLPGYRKRHYEAVDINAADTTEFIALPGIGSKLASRIVLFRHKLGGFDRVEQIREVYGLKDSVFLMLRPYLKCDSVYAGRHSLSYRAAR